MDQSTNDKNNNNESPPNDQKPLEDQDKNKENISQTVKITAAEVEKAQKIPPKQGSETRILKPPIKDDSTRIMGQEEKDPQKDQMIKDMWKQYEQEMHKNENGDKLFEPVKPQPQPVRPAPKPGGAPKQSFPALDREMSRHQQKTSKAAVLFIVFLIFVMAGAGIYFFVIEPQQRAKNDAALSRLHQKTVSSNPPIDEPIKKEPDISKFEYVLPNNDLWGEGQLSLQTEKSVISPEKDAEIVAIAKAFNQIGRKLFRLETRRVRRETVYSLEGSLSGIKLRTLYTGEVSLDKEEILLVLPSKGSLEVAAGKIKSLNNIDYDQIHQELAKADVSVVIKTAAESGKVTVQLNLNKYSSGFPGESFLIDADKVGGIQLAMPVAMIQSVLPPRYSMLNKRMLIEDTYIDIIKIFNDKDQSLLFINPRDNQVWRIHVADPVYKTRQGIGVGSTLGQIRTIYPEVKVHFPPKEEISASVKDIKGRFILSSRGVDVENKVFPDELTIVSIILENT